MPSSRVVDALGRFDEELLVVFGELADVVGVVAVTAAVDVDAVVSDFGSCTSGGG